MHDIDDDENRNYSHHWGSKWSSSAVLNSKPSGHYRSFQGKFDMISVKQVVYVITNVDSDAVAEIAFEIYYI